MTRTVQNMHGLNVNRSTAVMRRKKRTTYKMIAAIWGMLCCMAIGVLFLFGIIGSVGACDAGTISVLRCVLQMSVSMGMIWTLSKILKLVVGSIG